MKSRLFVIATLLTAIVASSGCVYRMDILQGNRLSAETIGQLELGMSRRQVEFLLGEPAIVDPYNPDTWHYVYYLRSGDDFSKTRKSMKLQFKNDLLAEITGDRDLSPES